MSLKEDDNYLKDTDRWYLPTGVNAEQPCICEVTPFGLVINDKCNYPHTKEQT